MTKQYEITLEHDGWTKTITVDEEIVDRGYVSIPMDTTLRFVSLAVPCNRCASQALDMRVMVFTPSRRPPYHWFGQPRH